MQKNEIIHSIRETARQVMPSGSRVILFGSQARTSFLFQYTLPCMDILEILTIS